MEEKKLTSANGRPIADNQNSQTAGPFDRLLLPFLKRSLGHRIAGFHRQLDKTGNILIGNALRTILENGQRQLRSFNRFLQCIRVVPLVLFVFLLTFTTEPVR